MTSRDASADYKDALSSLHTALVDSRNGYDEALKDAGKTGLVSLYEEMIALRRQAIAELEPLLVRAGVRFDEGGSFMSTVHRTIISFQSMLNDLDESVLPGFIDGEQRILSTYDDVIAKAGDPDREVLLRQRADLQERIAEMERRRHKAA
jgi:uncharacterized protein (TIGR02284 family)